MQQATHQGLHLRDAHDAHVVFEAVRLGYLSPISRRLNEMERNTLVRSGAVFVWFEAEDDSGLMRWTDGRSWGHSRIREPYLFCDEKMPYEAARAATEMNRGRFIDGDPRSGPGSSAISTPYHHSGLVKQTYSAWVAQMPDLKPQKWHIIAYFTYADLPRLPTVDHDNLLRKIVVPKGIYRSSHSRMRENYDPRSVDDSAHEELSMDGDSSSHATLPPIASLAVCPHPSPSPPRPPLPHGARLPEDQRLIHMLNSRHVL